MNFKSYLWLMGLGALLAWAGWLFVLFNVDPEETDALGFVLFYLTLFVSLVGSLAVLGVLFRVRRGSFSSVQIGREVRIALRHALMLSVVLVFTLALAASHRLSWWMLLVVCGFMGLLEYIFLLVQQTHRR